MYEKMSYPCLSILDPNYENNLYYAHLSFQKLQSGIMSSGLMALFYYTL